MKKILIALLACGFIATMPLEALSANKLIPRWSSSVTASQKRILQQLIDDMVAVEGGTFTMGATAEQESDAYSNEKPTHKVTLLHYMICKTEVTQELWQAVMGSNPSYFKGDKLPVEQVSWNDCQEFIKKLNELTSLKFRLPTEAEWEYAARGGNRSKGYKYSGSNDIGSVAWYYENSGNSILDDDNYDSDKLESNNCRTHNVATKAPNELGLYDMCGNVYEWCSDYGSISLANPTSIYAPGSTFSGHVTRGGCVGSFARICRVSFRDMAKPDAKDPFMGLRLAEGEESDFVYETYKVNGVLFNMVKVKGGTFTMGATSEQGSDVDSGENPTHQVTLSDYWIGQTEVTQELWKAVMGSNPSDFKGNKLPVESVSWKDSQKFIKKLNKITGLNFRMPTEAEWEYAARGGNRSKGYKYSGSNDIGSIVWYDDNSSGKTHNVATKAPNELGLYDMSGNVSEWCGDLYGDYSSGMQINPMGSSSGSFRVRRGGGWCNKASGCRVSNRANNKPNGRFNAVGLRLVMIDGEKSSNFVGKTYEVNDVTFDMVKVKGGKFTMGALDEFDAYDRDKPGHKVKLSSFMIGKTEVTQELWSAVMGYNPSDVKGDKLPVTNVSWNDCQKFIRELNKLTESSRPKGMVFRLPTEAEWEYAARGGKKSKRYEYSGSNDSEKVAWYYGNSSSKTHNVATKAPNELGLYDMSGNVYEWCNDWSDGYSHYYSDIETNPTGPSSGNWRVVRGGSWNNKNARSYRVSRRDRNRPDSRSRYLGLRLAL